MPLRTLIAGLLIAVAARGQPERAGGNAIKEAFERYIKEHFGSSKGDELSKAVKAGQMKKAAEMVGVPDLEEFSVIRPLDQMGAHVKSITFVRTRVKAFILGLAAGARNPDRAFAAIPEDMRAFLADWRAHAKEKREFLIGSGKDTGFIKRYIEARRREGIAVFFYKICEEGGPLCADEIAGGFLGDSSRVLVVDTANAKASPFVFAELAAAFQIGNGEALIIMVSPRDLLNAAEFNVTVIAVKTNQP